MSLKKITEADLAGKGVCGQADVPGLTAAEMQQKVEEIVRSVVIPTMNENAGAIEENFATKSELGEVVLESGSVSSVFGRAGAVAAQTGDYTAEMVGAAAKMHADRHKTGGADPIAPSDIGAAAAAHSHGNITSAGAIGMTKGLLVVTGPSGVLTTQSKSSSGFAKEPKETTASGDITRFLEDNTEYEFLNVTSITLSGGMGSCHGWIKCASGFSCDFSTFTAVAGDDPSEAAAGDLLEFSCEDGLLIVKNWGAV